MMLTLPKLPRLRPRRPIPTPAPVYGAHEQCDGAPTVADVIEAVTGRRPAPHGSDYQPRHLKPAWALWLHDVVTRTGRTPAAASAMPWPEGASEEFARQLHVDLAVDPDWRRTGDLDDTAELCAVDVHGDGVIAWPT